MMSALHAPCLFLLSLATPHFPAEIQYLSERLLSLSSPSCPPPPLPLPSALGIPNPGMAPGKAEPEGLGRHSDHALTVLLPPPLGEVRGGPLERGRGTVPTSCSTSTALSATCGGQGLGWGWQGGNG